MNNPLVLIIVLIVLAVAAALVFLARKRSSSPESSQPVLDIGAAGERYIKEDLQPLAGYKRFLSNCYVPKSDETLTEIDLILLHESGIYVIESKNYSGWIFGSENQKYWTQSLANGPGKKKTNSFYNPIWQNKGHLNCLKKYLDLGSGVPCYSVVVFSDRCELKNIPPANGKYFVVQRKDLLQTVQKNAKTAGRRLTREEIDTLYRRLYLLTQMSEEEKALHAERVRQKKSAPPAKPVTAAKAVPPVPKGSPKQEERVCPRCGGKLVLRTAGKGEHVGEEFWGCSNFPKCWHREYIEETAGSRS